MSPKVVHNLTGITVPEDTPWLEALCSGTAHGLGGDVRAGYTITN